MRREYCLRNVYENLPLEMVRPTTTLRVYHVATRRASKAKLMVANQASASLLLERDREHFSTKGTFKDLCLLLKL